MMLDGYVTEEILKNIYSKQNGEQSTNTYKKNQPKMYGWICPVCGRGLSPFTSVCPCRNKLEVTF